MSTRTDDLIRLYSLLDRESIRARLTELHAEERAQMTLLRAAHRKAEAEGQEIIRYGGPPPDTEDRR